MLYDPLSERWFACAAGTTEADCFLAVSTSSDPTKPWRGAKLPLPRINPYMKMGVDRNGLYVCSCNGNSDLNKGTNCYVIPKRDVLAEGVPVLTRAQTFKDLQFSTMPAMDPDADKRADAPAILLANEFMKGTCSRLYLYKITWSGSKASISDVQTIELICAAARRVAWRDPEAALPLIRRSACLHLEHITRGGDPFELLEARPLDFGHWSAHKMEALTGYALRHGEAVALGVAIDTVYSSLALGFPGQDVDRVLRCLGELGLPLGHPVLGDKDTLFAGLEEFRQHLGGRLTLTMLLGVGRPVEVHQVDEGLMRAAIDRVAALAPTDQAWAPARAEVQHCTGHAAQPAPIRAVSAARMKATS
jgi:hypothetical protein